MVLVVVSLRFRRAIEPLPGCGSLFSSNLVFPKVVTMIVFLRKSGADNEMLQ
jgi:hypothetical protein